MTRERILDAAINRIAADGIDAVALERAREEVWAGLAPVPAPQ